MRAVSHDTNGNFALNGICPHQGCNRPSVFLRVQSSNTGVIRTTPQGLPVVRWVAILQCQGCQKFILGIVEQIHNQGVYTYLEHFPAGSPDDSVSEHVPEEIQIPFKEALRCRWIKAYQATVLMCRRSLQVSCDKELLEGDDNEPTKAEKKQNSRKDLFQQIDELAAKQRITDPLRQMAHQIRLLGKRGAHSDYSDIDQTVGEPDADSAILFMRHYLDHVYILPTQLNAALSKQNLPQRA